MKRASLRLLYLLCLCVSPSVLLAHPRPAAAQSLNPIAAENRLAGTTGWMVHRYDASQLAGYADAPSVNLGALIDFHVSTTAPTFVIQIYRLGWYGGLGGRFLEQAGPLQGGASPCQGPTAGLGTVTCAWPVSYQLSVPLDWVSGLYVAKLISAGDQHEALVPFVVRDDRRPAHILYAIPWATYQAYNAFGGKSLYTGIGQTSDETSQDRALAVSFDRPLLGGGGSGQILEWDLPLIRWVERVGFDVTYATDVDIDENAAILTGHPLLVFGGHTEYWTQAMRDHVEAAVVAGLNVAFMGANNSYWQIRLSPGLGGAADHTETCYRVASLDPLSASTPSVTTVQWDQSPVHRPEKWLLGLSYGGSTWPLTSASPTFYPLVVTGRPSWAFSGTGLSAGSVVPGIVGPEFDSPSNATSYKYPDHGTLEYLALSPVTANSGASLTAAAALYHPSGATGTVFDAGTMFWSQGLDDFNSYSSMGFNMADGRGVVNAGLQQLTYNLFQHFAPDANVSPATSSPTDFTIPYTVASQSGSPIAAGASGLPVSSAAPVSVSLASGGPATIEFSLDGLTWQRYTQPLTIDVPASLQARSTSPIGITGPTETWTFIAAPTPTPTPYTPATSTPLPTPTSTATATPTATSTPTSTPTPLPTATPMPVPPTPTSILFPRPKRFTLRVATAKAKSGILTLTVQARGMHGKPIGHVVVRIHGPKHGIQGGLLATTGPRGRAFFHIRLAKSNTIVITGTRRGWVARQVRIYLRV